MEKEQLIQCVPAELIGRLKELLARLWEEKNPAAVHLGAVMDEFETDVKSLTGVVKEYETDFSGRLKFLEEGYLERTRTLEKELAAYKARFSGLDAGRAESARKTAELEEALRLKEAELAESKVKLSEEESQLNSKYVTKMQELYDRVSRKEMEMFLRWEEKNKTLESKYGSLEAEYAGKAGEFKLRERALEAEVNARKEELIKTFDKAQLELEAREQALSAREEKFAALEKKRPTVTEEL
jgi:chromosome segregation ATPase